MAVARKIGIALCLALLASMSVSGCKKFNLLSKDEEIRIGREGSAEIEKKIPISRNPADIALVENIGQKLIAANNLKNWPYTFKVVEDREINAFALPGGPIYIHRGLLDLTEGNEDELACIIGHEMGHVENRHAAKMYSQGLLADLAIILGTRGQVATAADIIKVFGQMRYSRDNEYESDSFGLRAAYKAGYDPNGMIRFFTKMKRKEAAGNKDIIENNLRSHPLTQARIDRAKKEILKIIQAVNLQIEVEYAQTTAKQRQ